MYKEIARHKKTSSKQEFNIEESNHFNTVKQPLAMCLSYTLGHILQFTAHFSFSEVNVQTLNTESQNNLTVWVYTNIDFYR